MDIYIYTHTHAYSRTPVSAESVSAVYHSLKKNLENERNKEFVSFKMHAKRERAVTW
jgi:hypothetical protein